ncbi:MAG: hypothetical protein GC145_04845 [Caulobacter sp.]|nr:hypothetical protein [Caulobacter sp.]
MAKSGQISNWTFPSGADWGLMTVSPTAIELAKRTGCNPEDWEEDGLGPAQGFFFRLESGPVFLVKQLLLAGTPNTTIYVDAGEAGKLGAIALRDHIVAALRLDQSEIDWWPDDVDAWASCAAELATRASRYLQEKSGRPSGRKIED